MADTGGDARTLAELRGRIDTIDGEMHRLLMERGAVIDALIAAKDTRRPGAAFRPGREADMMRRLAARHDDSLPLATVEHIWREIIGTFTHLQAPFDVAYDASQARERMQDLTRFLFGFSVAIVACQGPEAVVSEVSEGGRLGVVPRFARAPWWRGLGGPGPCIMAVTPFLLVPGRPAGMPAFVISPPLADPALPEVRVVAIDSDAVVVEPSAEVAVLEAASDADGTSFLVAHTTGATARGIAERVAPAARRVVDVGGFQLPVDARGERADLAVLARQRAETVS